MPAVPKGFVVRRFIGNQGGDLRQQGGQRDNRQKREKKVLGLQPGRQFSRILKLADHLDLRAIVGLAVFLADRFRPAMLEGLAHDQLEKGRIGKVGATPGHEYFAHRIGKPPQDLLPSREFRVEHGLEDRRPAVRSRV